MFLISTNFLLKLTTIFVILLTITTKTTQNELDINKVRLVDYAYSPSLNETGKFNVIFRSNIPEDKTFTKFEYDQLIDYMIEIAFSEKLLKIDREDVYIMDFTLLQESDPMKAIEVDYFKNYPEKGEVRGWSVLGEKKNPADYSLDEIIKKSKNLNWMEDKIEDWVDEIRKTLLDFSRDKNLLILIHCHWGKDRTGEIGGGYQLKYGHQTWNQVTATNWEMYKDSIVYKNQRALTWFCYHLQYWQSYSNLNCSNEMLSKKDDKKPIMVGWDIEDYDESTDGWKIAFFSLLSGTVFGVFIILGVIVLIGLFLSRNFIGRKFADVRDRIRKGNENNGDENGYENVEKNNQIGDDLIV